MADMTSDDIAAVVEQTVAGAESSPAPTPTPEVSPAPATAAPGEGASPPAEEAGPIPFERHKAILEKAREDARKQTETEYRQKLGWAERYQPDQVEQAQRLLSWYQQDPTSFLAWLQSQQPKKDEPPQPDLRAEDGTPVYSAPQLQKLLEYQRTQLQQQVQQEYGPVRQAVEVQRMQAQAFEQAQKTLAAAREKWPRFTDLEGDIKEAMRGDPSLDLRDAYIQVYAEKGKKLEQDSWRAEYEGTVVQKSAATTPRPGRAAQIQPRRYTEMDPRDVVEDVAKSIGYRG